jgi:transcriptional regulator with XRE-family HTH domain
MSITTELFDRYKAAHGIDSDNQAGLKLGIRRQTISRWRNDPEREGEPETVKKIAVALGMSPDAVVIATTATQQRGEENRRILMDIARKMGYAALLCMSMTQVYAMYTCINMEKCLYIM